MSGIFFFLKKGGVYRVSGGGVYCVYYIYICMYVTYYIYMYVIYIYILEVCIL